MTGLEGIARVYVCVVCVHSCCLRVCLWYIDKCKLYMLTILCMCVLQYNASMKLGVCGGDRGEMDGALQHFLSHSIQLDRMY